MDKLMKTSKTVDTILKVVYKILQVAAIILLVGGAITLVGSLLDEIPTTEITSVSVGDVELIFAEPQQVENEYIITEVMVMILIALIVICIAAYMVKLLRRVLVPMIQGQPFVGTVSSDLKKLGIVIIVGGLVMDVVQSIGSNMLFYMQNMAELFLSEQVTKVTVNSGISLGNVLIGVLVIMLSHVFRYGEELQQQADETL